MNQNLALGLGLLAAGALAFLLIGPADDEPAIAPNLDPAALDRQSLVQAELPGAEQSDRQAMPVLGTAAEGAEASLPSISAAPVGGVEVQVELGSSGEPATGALVYQVKSADLMWFQWPAVLIESGDSVSDEVLGKSACYQVDERGVVVVEDGVGETLLVAVQDELIGFLAMGVDYQTGMRIELREPLSVAIEVEDSLGRPVEGYPVAIDGIVTAMARAVWDTNGEGRVELHQANTFLPLLRGGVTLAEISVKSWLGKAQVESIDLSTGTPAPLVFRLPDAGEVVLTVRDVDGQPLVNPKAWVSLVLVDGGEESRRNLKSADGAIFRGLPVGSKVLAKLHSRKGQAKAKPVEGVVLEGRALELELLVTPPGSEGIQGRAVDQNGAPLANMDLQLRRRVLGGAHGWQDLGTSKTDAGGGFGFDIEPIVRAPSAAGSSNESGMPQGFELRLNSTSRTPDLKSSRLAFDAAIQFPIGVGDVMLSPMPLLIAGRVLDHLGEPVEGVIVRVQGGDHPASEFKGFGAETLSAPATGADGGFSFYAEPEQRYYAAQVYRGWKKETPWIGFNPGTDGIELPIEQFGSIAGTIKLPAGLESVPMRFAVQPMEKGKWFAPTSKTGKTWPGPDWIETDIAPTGSFGWDHLPAGLYNTRLTIFTESFSDQAAFVWDRVEVRGGEVTRDPRMQDLDVSALVDVIDITMVDSDGEPPVWPTYQVITEGVPGAYLNLPAGGGPVLARLGSEALFMARGSLTQALRLEESKMRVVMQPAPTISLGLPPGVQVPDSVHAFVVARGQGTVGLAKFIATFEEGQWSLQAPALGKLSLEFQSRSKAAQEAGVKGSGNDRLTIEVSAEDDGKVFVLDVDQARLNQLLGL